MVRMCWWPFPFACVRLLQCFHTFVSPSVCHPNRTLSSKRSLMGQNHIFGSCCSASPQNVPPLCHSKDWEDAAGYGHKEERRGWYQQEKKKTWAQKPEGHTLSIPTWAKAAYSLEQRSSLNLRASVRKCVWGGSSSQTSESITDSAAGAGQLSYQDFICYLCHLTARLHKT